MGSRRYRQYWGHQFKLGKEVPVGEGGRFVPDGAIKYANDKAGYHLSTSVKGSNTGEGGDRIVTDDPHNIKEIHSDAMRESTVTWWSEVMSTRVNDPKNYAKVAVMQRGHEHEVSGHMLGKGGVVHICLPTEWDPKPIVYPNALPPLRPDPRTRAGELLCPERFGPDEVAQAKIDLGSYGYASQHQQRPYPTGGTIFLEHYWRYWVPVDSPIAADADGENIIVLDFGRIAGGCISMDCSFKDSPENDRVAMGAWAKVRGYRGWAFMLDQIVDWMDFDLTVKTFRMFCGRWPQLRARLIEEAANGTAVISTLRKKVPGIIAVNPGGNSKLSRAYAVQPYLEARNVVIPHPSVAPWVTTHFIPEVSAFPNSTRDDQVDEMVYALLRLLGAHVFSGDSFADVDLG